jgi:hypothetical protein
MKSIALGFLWFIVIWLIAAAGGGAIVGMIAEHEAATSNNQTTTFQQGYSLGHDAGARFGQKYGGIILVGALALAVSGTVFGILPGTGRRKKESNDQ